MTPIQQLIEVLKIHRDTSYDKVKVYPDLEEYYDGRGQAFEDAISFAELHLEKEQQVMCEFAIDYTMQTKTAYDFHRAKFNNEL